MVDFRSGQKIDVGTLVSIRTGLHHFIHLGFCHFGDDSIGNMIINTATDKYLCRSPSLFYAHLSP